MKATYIDHMGTDLSVVNAARVSFGKQSDWVCCVDGVCTGECFGGDYDHPQLSVKDQRLINYLAKHGHHSPFNHTYLTFHMKAPIFVARQLVKHKFMPWNEVSRRYVDDPPELYWPAEWRGKSEDKKQGSDGVVKLSSHDFQMTMHYPDECVNWYRALLGRGVCEEQARMVLPLNTYTEWYWSGTLHAWSEMYNLRSKEDTQQETRELITQIDPVMNGLFPVSWKALTKENP